MTFCLYYETVEDKENVLNEIVLTYKKQYGWSRYF